MRQQELINASTHSIRTDHSSIEHARRLTGSLRPFRAESSPAPAGDSKTLTYFYGSIALRFGTALAVAPMHSFAAHLTVVVINQSAD